MLSATRKARREAAEMLSSKETLEWIQNMRAKVSASIGRFYVEVTAPGYHRLTVFGPTIRSAVREARGALNLKGRCECCGKVK